jgi:hypothetical protein
MKPNRYLAALACAGLAAGTVSLSQLGPVGFVSAAYAKNGGGNGGGNGNGGNGGNASGHSADHGKSAEAHDKNDAKSREANALGALNAAHASAKARAHASPNSAVGKIATYEKSREAALSLQDPAAQQQALETAEAKLAASFGMSSLSPEQVSQVNALLDARK